MADTRRHAHRISKKKKKPYKEHKQSKTTKQKQTKPVVLEYFINKGLKPTAAVAAAHRSPIAGVALVILEARDYKSKSVGKHENEDRSGSPCTCAEDR